MIMAFMKKTILVTLHFVFLILLVFVFIGCSNDKAIDDKQTSESKFIPPWQPPKDAANKAKDIVEKADRDVQRQLDQLDR